MPNNPLPRVAQLPQGSGSQVPTAVGPQLGTQCAASRGVLFCMPSVAHALLTPLLNPKQGAAAVGRLREGTCYVVVAVPSGGAGKFNNSFQVPDGG